MIRSTRRLLAGVGLALAAAAPAAAQGYEFRYHDYAESTRVLHDLARQFPELARVYSIGTSKAGNKEVWLIEISNQRTGPAESKPAAYFDGNQHDSEVMGGEVTLYLAHHLLHGYGRDPEITRAVDTRVTYIVQRANPDGAEYYMKGRVDWDPDTVSEGVDRDGDGRKGEDGPSDVDGDGEILTMRVRDPDGEWKPYAGDPRLMVRRERGDTRGPFYRLLEEGIDDDGDGRINEDPPFTRFITNRNYPTFWMSESGRYRGEGEYPLSEHNSRLLVDFIVSRPHISMIESYHTTSGVHLRPYSPRPDTDFPAQDLLDYQAILSKGTEITTYPVGSIYNDFTDLVPGLPADEQPGARRGVFVDWGYVDRGVFTVTTELWTLEPFVNEVGWGDIPRDKPLFAIPGRYNRPDVQAVVLQWLDRNRGNPDLAGEGFVDWKPFQHPQLGPVEIGGFTRYWLRNPPPGPYFEKIARDQADFAVMRILMTPRVVIRDVSVEPLAAARGAAPEWRVRAVVANEGYLDTSMQQARLTGTAKPVVLSVGLPAGARTADPVRKEFEFARGTRGAGFESRYEAEWRVSAPAGAEIEIVSSSEKGGTERRRVVLGGG
jgi:hypothetical protein